MTPDDIAALAAKGESETLELKKTTGERREAAKTACAMLNHQGGLIIIGVTPERRVTGQQVGNSSIEDVSKEFQEIEPPAFPSIERIPVEADMGSSADQSKQRGHGSVPLPD